MKLLSVTAAACALAAALAATVGLAATPAARAETLCTVVAEHLDGEPIDATRSQAIREARHLACGDAVAVCGAKLTTLRQASGVFPGPWPGAYCQVEGAVTLAPSARRCNVAACADAYRSFRASDCSYQPSVGPRRLCAR